MRKALQRRTVYGATIVAILALVAGFAMATLGFSSTISSNQNVVSTNVGETVWNGATDALTPSFLTSAISTCSGAPAFTSTPGSQDICISATGAAPATESSVARSDFVEEFAFTLAVTSSTCTSGCSDNWVITVSSTTPTDFGAVTLTVTIANPGVSGNDVLNVYIDFGTSAPATISAMDIVVTGS